MAEVLVVEDDAAIRDVVVYQLARAGHRVEAVADGVAGLEQFRSARPDLVIADRAAMARCITDFSTSRICGASRA